MSRTDDLEQAGARRIGGGGGSGFIHWPEKKSGDEYMWIEGEITDFWEGKYGRLATLQVSACSPNAKSVSGAGDERVTEKIEPDSEVNIGLNYSALEPLDNTDYKGKRVHVAFEGWEKPKDGGNAYRLFRIFELDRQDAEDAVDEDDKSYNPEEDDLPF